MFGFSTVAQTAAVRTRPANRSHPLLGLSAGQPVSEARGTGEGDVVLGAEDRGSAVPGLAS